MSFVKSTFDSTIPPMTLSPDDFVLLARVTKELQGYIECLEKQKIRDGLKHILSISRLGNGHIQSHKPWELVKGTPEDKLVIICFVQCPSIHLPIHPFIYLSIHSSTYPFIYLSIHSSTYLSIHLSIHPLFHLSIHSFICPSIHLFIHLSIHSFISPFIHSSIHLSIHSFIYPCRAKGGSLLGICANICCLISVLLQPYMPTTSEEIQKQLQVTSL